MVLKGLTKNLSTDENVDESQQNRKVKRKWKRKLVIAKDPFPVNGKVLLSIYS